MSLSIRRAGQSDWAGIRQLLQARNLPLDGAEPHLESFLVATEERTGAVVGVVGLERYGNVGLLRSVAVAESLGKHGVGTALVQTSIERARAGGIRALFLLTTTAADWFPRFGFISVRREDLPASMALSAELRGACPASAVPMRLSLA